MEFRSFNVHASGGNPMMEAAATQQNAPLREGIARPVVLGLTVLTASIRDPPDDRIL